MSSTTRAIGVRCPFSGLDRFPDLPGSPVKYCSVCDCFGLTEEEAMAEWAAMDQRARG